MPREFLGVGIDDYKDARYNNLARAISDASALRGFFAFGLPTDYRFDRTELLSNPLAREVTSYLEDALTRLDEDSVFVFYFAGHGLFRRDFNRQLLLCRDALGVLADGYDGTGAIPLDFMRYFSQRGKGNMFFCFDACRREVQAEGGRASDAGGANGFRFATSERPDANLGGSGRRWSLQSCGAGQLAKDDGSFVKALIAEMSETLSQGRDLTLGSELVEGITRRLGSANQRPEASGAPFLLASGAKPAFEAVDVSTEEETRASKEPEPDDPADDANSDWIDREEWASEKEQQTLFDEISSASPELTEEIEEDVASTAEPNDPFALEPEPRASRALGDRAAGARKVVRILGANVAFRWAPPGRFLMGSGEGNRREVLLTKGFWIAETPTTQLFWRLVMEDEPSFFNGDDLLPVERVSWFDCQEFGRRLNELDLADVGVFRLPTEAEWEYACRAGTTTAYPWGDAPNDEMANYFSARAAESSRPENYLKRTTRVGSYPANPWGLFDMNGNVWEWCADRYGEYSAAPQTETLGATEGAQRVQRGGSCDDEAVNCRATARQGINPTNWFGLFGCRLVMTEPESRDETSSQSFNANEEIFATPPTPGPRAAGARKVLTIAGVEVAFRWAPCGSFTMGSPADEEDREADETQHQAIITRGFWLAETPTTQALWKAATGENPSWFDGDDLPIEGVNWNDCRAFLATLNALDVPGAGVFRLPTETEWEYACRAGAATAYPWGNELNGDKANCDGRYPSGTDRAGKYLAATTKVGSYPANSWGFFDMIGNVWEWCSDWYGAYPSGTQRDPQGAREGRYRVLRGGSWDDSAASCRSACRGYYDPTGEADCFGFRIAMIDLDSYDERDARASVDARNSVDVEPASEERNEPPKATSKTTRRKRTASADKPRAAGARKVLTIAGVEVAFRWAPPGRFLMGSPEDEEGRWNDEPQRETILTQGFWLAETPTTQRLWRAVMKENPSWFKGDDLRPVECICWKDCKTFVKKLNALKIADAGLFRLPIETEWEYACRAGTQTAYPWGSNLCGDMANCDGNYPYGTKKRGKYREQTTRVGSFPANKWGLFDMNGNVWEWCNNSYRYCQLGKQTVPIDSQSGLICSLRGGSWIDAAIDCRSAHRGFGDSESGGPSCGCRLAMIDL